MILNEWVRIALTGVWVIQKNYARYHDWERLRNRKIEWENQRIQSNLIRRSRRKFTKTITDHWGSNERALYFKIK